MKIALIGTGKMGTAIEPLAIKMGHEVVLRIDHDSRSMLAPEILSTADVAIEFTRPDAVVSNLQACLKAGIPVICGTTGWMEHYKSIKAQFLLEKGALLTASNFSIGVNLLFELNRQLSSWMDTQPQYSASMIEVHHTHKIDKPSGTALTLAEGILSTHHRYSSWELNDDSTPENQDILAIDAQREENVVGDHSIIWQSEVDKISLHHSAFSRNGFASGAIKASEWIMNKTGVFTFRDVLFPA